jgi:hypothetical protein
VVVGVSVGVALEIEGVDCISAAAPEFRSGSVNGKGLGVQSGASAFRWW